MSNRGPTAVQTSIIKISWPSYDSRGLNLLQIEGDPEVSRPDVSCIFYNHNVSTFLLFWSLIEIYLQD